MAQMNDDYQAFLTELKKRISSSRQAAVRALNTELILLYWDIGDSILRKQSKEGWGTKVIDRLAIDLKSSFKEMKGFSVRNLKYMRLFAETWREKEIVQTLVAQLSWSHNVALLDKLSNNSDK
jgi:predicted nuclease of restriction endonuclease-like (RecB) superfamily